MWLAKLKKKKMQNFLLGIIFAISIAMICVSTVLTAVSANFATKYYEGDNTPDILTITTNESVVNKIHNFYKDKDDKVRNYNKYDIFSISTNLTFINKNNTTLMSCVVPIEDKRELSNKIEIKDGDKESEAPKSGEMWVSSTTANSKNVKVGDKAKITDGNGKSLEYKISAIVNDSNQSSTSIGILIVYVNEADRENLESLPKANMVTFNCDGDTSKMSNELVEYINEPIGGAIVNKSLFILAATMTSGIIGGIGLITGIILIVMLMLILKSNIKNNILREYKSIGTYKSMGYSSKKIRRIYSYGYGLVSIISSLIGIIISIPMITYICNIAFKNMGNYSFDGTSVAIMLITFLIFNLIVYITVYSVLSCINKIKPVEAINIGVTSSKEKLKKSLIKNNSSSFCMAINDIFKYKKSNFISLIVFILVFYISILFLNIAYSMKALDDNLYKIFGTANSDLIISAPTDIENSISEVKKYIDLDNRVDNYYTWDVVAQGKVGIDASKYEVEEGAVIATIYNKFNEEDFSIVKGINPRNKNEVSLSVDLMKNNNLDLGDYIRIKVEDEEKEFLIVGSFASMMSNGQSIRLTSDVISDNSIGNVAFINLKSVDDYEALKNDIKAKFDGVKVEKIYSPLKEAASQVVEISVPISIVLLVGVLVFGIFNIVNVLLINNLDNRKNYGVMKSLGFTSKYIRARNNYRIMILAILGAIIGILVAITTSSKVIQLAMGFDVFKLNLVMTSGLVLITFVLIMIALHVCNRSIKKISTVELIRE